MKSQNLYGKIRLTITAAAYLILSTFPTNAQMKVGLPAGTADASAILDASNTGGGNTGFLAPKVALTSLTSAAPVTTPATGLLVYNTATAGTSPNNVVPGHYFWNGTQWIKMVTSSSTTADGNIYSNDGTLASNRIVTMGSNSLTFTGNSGAALTASGNMVSLGGGNPATTLTLNGNESILFRGCPNTGAAYTLTAADIAFSVFATYDGAYASPLTLPPASAGQVQGQILYIVNQAVNPVTISGINTDNTASVLLENATVAGLHGAMYMWVAAGGGYWLRIQ